MSSSKKKCPIPLSQQPLNEYEILKRSCFFSWPTHSLTNFLLKLLGLWFLSCILVFPILVNTLSNFLQLYRFVVLDLIISNFIVILFLIRLYLGWSYIMQRLISATVFYEESGWYDGQIWIKTPDVLMQDRLIGLYEVTPLLSIIKRFLIGSVLLLVLVISAYYYIL